MTISELSFSCTQHISHVHLIYALMQPDFLLPLGKLDEKKKGLAVQGGRGYHQCYVMLFLVIAIDL